MLLISVIVPVFKVEKYLNRCIDSIRSQTFSDFELLLIDDGSPDLSSENCDGSALIDERVITIHQKNQGQGAARNRGVALASGEWIHFVDSDDMIHPQMLEILYEALQGTDAKISMCGYEEAEKVSEHFSDSVKYPYCTNTVNICEEKLSEYCCVGKSGFYWIVWAKLIRKEIVSDLRFAEGHYYEDNAVAGIWLHQAGSVVEVNVPLYFYQVNQDGTTKGKNPQKYVDILWALREQLRYFDSVGYKELTGRVINEYLEKSVGYYWYLKRELKDDKRAGVIKRYAVEMFLAYYLHIGTKRMIYLFKIVRMFLP